MSKVTSIHQAHHHAAPQGETLLCLHCSGSSGRQWDAYPALLPAGTRVIAPNLLGYDSLAEWPLGKPVAPQDEALRIATEHLAGIAGGVHVLGHSYGGWVALQLALRWPHLVKSVTVYEPVCFGLLRPHSDAPDIQPIFNIAQQVWRLTVSRCFAAAAEVFVDYWSGPGTFARMPVKRRDMAALRMPKVSAEFSALFADTVPLTAYAQLQMPVHLLRGTHSPKPVLHAANLLEQGCPQARTTRFDGLGHMGPVAAPQRIAETMQWIGELMQLPKAA
jgi:pimeloyl-ACP methyl ester carboxylesterase